LSYPKGKRGANQEVLKSRAVALLKDLIAHKNAAERVARITQELNTCYVRGYSLACRRHASEPQDDSPR
jgi:hypothetical protein